MDIDKLTQEVLKSASYRQVDPAFVRRLAETEAAKGRSYKETVKAVKNKLHQVGGAYFPTQIDYAKSLGELKDARGELETALGSTRDTQGDSEAFRAACKRIMAGHASTKERLPVIESFYKEVLEGIPQPGTVLDVACGLNPLAFSWMGLPHATRYLAFDIYADMIQFLNGYFELAGINGQAVVSSVIESPPEERADLAFVLKAVPCLEQVDKSAGKRLVQSLKARRLVVSFPGKSLGGRSKGMVENYEAHFHEILGAGQRIERRVELGNELIFVVQNDLEPQINADKR